MIIFLFESKFWYDWLFFSIFNWTVFWLFMLVVIVLFIGVIVLYYFLIRVFILLWGKLVI